MKILLINSIAHYSVNDVFRGYLSAFYNLGVQVEAFDWSTFRRLLSDEECLKTPFTQLNRKELGFTHVIFINCHEVPDWFLLNIPKHITKVQIEVDDPWDGFYWNDRRNCYDIICTNERLVAKKYNVYYLPTAWDSHLSINTHPQKPFHIGFIGSLYPDRYDFLNAIMPAIKKLKLTFVGIGPVSKGMRCPAWWENRVIPHDQYLAIAKSAKIMLHLNRNPAWKYDNTLPNALTKRSESICPRIYEHAAMGIFTLSDNRRKELHAVFPLSVPMFTDAKHCINKIESYINDSYLRDCCTNLAARQSLTHTYTHRAKRLLELMSQADHVERIDNRKETPRGGA